VGFVHARRIVQRGDCTITEIYKSNAKKKVNRGVQCARRPNIRTARCICTEMPCELSSGDDAVGEARAGLLFVAGWASALRRGGEEVVDE